jgi:hypothetical protein
MFASQRKMKRTKKEQLQLIENMNRDALGQLINQHNGLINGFVNLQKNFLAVMNILKARGILDDFAMHQELQRIDEMEILQKKALIIDPNKPTVK